MTSSQQPPFSQSSGGSSSADLSPGVRNSPSQISPSSNDEIDLIDLMRTVWDLKWFAVGGVVVGLCVALLVVPFVVKTKYTTKFNLIVDAASLPAIATPDEVVKRLNEQLGTERADRLLSDEIRKEFPEWSKKVSPEGFLLSGRTAASPKDLPVALEGSLGSSKFLVTATLPERPVGSGNFAAAISRGLNALILAANEDAERLYRTQGQVALRNAQLTRDATLAVLRETNQSETSLVSLATRIQNAEFALESLVQSLNPRSREFLPKPTLSGNRNGDFEETKGSSDRSANGMMYRVSNERLLRSFAILAMVESQIPGVAQEVARRREEFSLLQSELEATNLRRLNYQRVADGAQSAYIEVLRVTSLPIDPAKSFLPQFLTGNPRDAVPTSAAPEGADGGAPKSQENIPVEMAPMDAPAFAAKPSRSTTLALSAILGGVLGLMAGFGIRVLPQAFRERERSRLSPTGL